MFKVGDKVVAKAAALVPEGSIGTVIAMRPLTCPNNPDVYYAESERGMLVQSPSIDIHIHGTPNTAWDFIKNWRLAEEGEE